MVQKFWNIILKNARIRIYFIRSSDSEPKSMRIEFREHFFCSNASRTNKNQRNPNSFGFWIFQSILTKVGDRLVDGWIMFMCWTIALQLWKHFNLCLVQIEFQFIPAFLCRLMCFVLFIFLFLITWKSKAENCDLSPRYNTRPCSVRTCTFW